MVRLIPIVFGAISLSRLALTTGASTATQTAARSTIVIERIATQNVGVQRAAGFELLESWTSSAASLQRLVLKNR
jgi:hypothetical protein